MAVPRLAHWFAKRIWNDREVRGGLLQTLTGAWMIWFSGNYISNSIFLPGVWYAVACIATGTPRLLLSASKDKLVASYAALFSTFIWALGAANLYISGEGWRLIMLFFLAAWYDSLISFSRLNLLHCENKGRRLL